MNTTAAVDEIKHGTEENAGSQLARIREKKGFTREYVAGKLHLRVRLIELLEADEYTQMPEPVFIMGYLRAYAKLLGVAPEPFIQLFSTQYSLEKKPEKAALWQSRRESNKGELVVRWFTALVAVTAVLAVSFWWQKNKEEQPFFSAKNKSVITPVKTAHMSAKDNINVEPEVKMTDLSKMESMFSSNAEEVAAEKKVD